MTQLGHNSKAILELLVDRIEAINEEVMLLAAARRNLYKEGERDGMDARVVRRLVAYRKIPEKDRKVQDPILDSYMQLLGMKQ